MLNSYAQIPSTVICIIDQLPNRSVVHIKKQTNWQTTYHVIFIFVVVYHLLFRNQLTSHVVHYTHDLPALDVYRTHWSPTEQLLLENLANSQEKAVDPMGLEVRCFLLSCLLTAIQYTQFWDLNSYLHFLFVFLYFNTFAGVRNVKLNKIWSWNLVKYLKVNLNCLFLFIHRIHHESFIFAKMFEMLSCYRYRYAEHFWYQDHLEIPWGSLINCILKTPAKIAVIIDLPHWHQRNDWFTPRGVNQLQIFF